MPGTFKVVQVVKKEELIAEGLYFEDATAIMEHRAANQISRSYSFEVRHADGTLSTDKQAHGKA